MQLQRKRFSLLNPYGKFGCFAAPDVESVEIFSFLIDTCLFCKSLNRVCFESVQ